MLRGGVPRVLAGPCRGRRVQRPGRPAGLDWRRISVLRAYARYLRQTGSAFSQEYIEPRCWPTREIARLLVELFEARFDPDLVDDRAGHGRAAGAPDRRPLDDVASLDQDRILRSLLALIRRDAAHQLLPARDGGPTPGARQARPARSIPDLPEPRPKFEIWVYSPRVEGVHLRFGSVARGGLRWSDRREDFRTEVLGLVKAQVVKNAVIVPVGAKGGFVVKQLPDPASDREALAGRGHRLLPARSSARCSTSPTTSSDGAVVPPARRRAPRRRRPLPRGGGRQGHGDVLRHRQRRRRRVRLLARRRVRLRRLGGLRPQGDGHHRPRAPGSRSSGTSASSGVDTQTPGRSPSSASAT